MPTPRKKPRLLTNLVIDEVSAVSRGAGEGVRVMLTKRHDDKPTDFYKIFGARRPPRQFGYEPDPIRKYRYRAGDVDAPRFAEPDTIDNTDTNNTDELSGGGGGTQHLSELADLLVEASSGQITRQQALYWLMHDKHGRALARHAKHAPRREQPMTITEQIAKAGLDPVSVCKTIASDGKSYSITEHKLTELIRKYASESRRPGESAASAFARVFSADDDEGLAIRKAVSICRNEQFVSRTSTMSKAATLTPRLVGGADARAVNNPKSALDQLNELVAEQRKQHPTLTEAGAFAQVYADHPDLAAQERLENRPS